jgi:plastocyanin domain-containing protein
MDAPASPPLRAIRVAVGSSGYTPARIDLRRGEPAVLAFSRPDAGNCGGTVVIPALGIRRELPVGETVVLRFTPDRAGEIPFTCGMGMYEGLIVVH